MTILAAAYTENNSNGNGQFGALTRAANRELSDKKFNEKIFEQKDARMRFRNSADPIYVAFDYLESQPLSKLAASFVKDSVSGIINFVSTVAQG